MTLNKNLTVLKPYKTLTNALCDILAISKSAIKKSDIPLNILKRDVKANQSIAVPIELLNRGMVNTGKTPEIIFEDSSFLVLDKPVGVHCHPLTYKDSNNILSFIRQDRDPSLLNVNKKDNEKGLLFRLDQVTSGIIIYVKDEELLNRLRSSYSSRVLKKRYLAIVSGEFKKTGTVQLFLKPSGPKGKKITVTNEELSGSKEAIEEIELLEYNKEKDLSLLQIDLKTGLRHQIRATLAHLNHPILGDKLYGGAENKRVWLHSYLYEINHQQIQTFRSGSNIKIADIIN